MLEGLIEELLDKAAQVQEIAARLEALLAEEAPIDLHTILVALAAVTHSVVSACAVGNTGREELRDYVTELFGDAIDTAYAGSAIDNVRGASLLQ
jgi:hypothetical protein